MSIFVEPINGKIIEGNKQACDFYGYSCEEFRTMSIYNLDMFNNESLLDNIQLAAKSLNDGTEVKCIYAKHKLRNGDFKDVELYANKVTMFGQVMYILQVIDISERKKAERQLQESESRFRALVELAPEVIVVCQNNKIVFVNSKAIEFFNVDNYESLLGCSFLSFLDNKSYNKFKITLEKLLKEKQGTFKSEFVMIDYFCKSIDTEISGTYIFYNGQDSVQLIIRNISEEKKEIERAVRIQKHSLIKAFPIQSKGQLNHIWVPAKGVSGDFFELHKIDDNYLVGIIGDVSGKGIKAALNVSALKVLFYEAVHTTHDPSEILNYLNVKVMEHFDEDYIAALCFSINFESNILEVVGAGINEFIYYNSENEYRKIYVKGPFLGMFHNGLFGKYSSKFKGNDKLLFYSDGMEFIFENQENLEKGVYMNLNRFCEFLEEKIDNQLKQVDDCTCLFIQLC